MVVAPSPRRAAPALARACAAAGVPFASGRGARLAEAPPVRAVLDALDGAGGLDRSAAERLAASSYLAPGDLRGALGPLLDRAGALDGRGPPQAALRRRAAALTSPVAAREREALLRAAGALDALAAARPAPRRRPAPRASTRAGSPRFVDAAGLRRRAARAPREIAARDLAALAALGDAFDGLARALALVGRGAERLAPAALRALARLAVDEAALAPAPEPAAGAVELFGLDEAPGLSARAAVLTGCARGAWPPAPAPEPLLREPERQALCRHLRRAAVADRAGAGAPRRRSGPSRRSPPGARRWPSRGPRPGPPATAARSRRSSRTRSPRSGVAGAGGGAAGSAARARRARRARRSGPRRAAARPRRARSPRPRSARARPTRSRADGSRGRGARRCARAAPRRTPGALGPARAARRSRRACPRSGRRRSSRSTRAARSGSSSRSAVRLDGARRGRARHRQPRRGERRARGPRAVRPGARRARRVAARGGRRGPRRGARQPRRRSSPASSGRGAPGDPAVWAARREAVLSRLERVVRAEARDHGGLAPALLEHAFGGRSGRPPLARPRGGRDRAAARADRPGGRGPRPAPRPRLQERAGRRRPTPSSSTRRRSAARASRSRPTSSPPRATSRAGRASLATYALLRSAERLEPLELAADDPALAADAPPAGAGDARPFAASVVDLVRRIRDGDFPIASRSCDHCPFGAVCRFEGAAAAGADEDAA